MELLFLLESAVVKAHRAFCYFFNKIMQCYFYIINFVFLIFIKNIDMKNIITTSCVALLLLSCQIKAQETTKEENKTRKNKY